MYDCIVMYYRPQKEDPHRTRLTVGENLFCYSGDVSTPTEDISTANIITNSTI